ncbi:HdeD family acid-resistance protein [Candidatus Micrarchaeota archaeon]|nr:HdeD family acid-resistance protein [Candidatus Micrarchaeota archaeon]
MAKTKTIAEELHNCWSWFFALGVLLLLFGFAVIIFPAAGTFTVEILFGIILLVAGITQVVLAFQARKWGGFLFTLLAGLLYLVVGVLLLVFPLQGTITLTLLLGAALLLGGIFKVALAFKTKPDMYGWLTFDGVISLLLGALVLAGWPSDAVWVMGLLFGIDLLFSGLSQMMIAFALKYAGQK